MTAVPFYKIHTQTVDGHKGLHVLHCIIEYYLLYPVVFSASKKNVFYAFVCIGTSEGCVYGKIPSACQ